ncbi:MAG: HAD family hydrolase [Clostridium sp.]|nr:HAD family hydrolase [Clostridium sp.]
MNKIHNLIFDFDGTLMDTAPLILATMRETIGRMGFPVPDEAACRATIGLRLEDIPARLLPGRPECGGRYAALYRDVFSRLRSEIRPVLFPRVTETLDRLQRKGFAMAVASSRGHESLDGLVADYGLEGFFCMVIGGDDVKEGKPSPEPVLRICDRMGWKPAETLVVGDADVDIRMGRAAGCTTCGVTYGNGTVEQLRAAGAHHLLSGIEELCDVMRKMNLKA